MTLKKTSISAIIFLILGHIGIYAQTTTEALRRSTPEIEGVSSEGINNFLDAMAKSKNEMHSLMILRHGKVVAEGWWNPYRPDLKHTMYSTSKSFTATAIGFAVSEKRLTVNDKVVSFFPKDLPDTVSTDLAALTVKDLLTMSAGQFPEPTGPVIVLNNNWVKGFFAVPIVHKPGSQFLYNSLCTYMLSAIVQKVTGEKVLDYLKPRLLDPLSIQGVDWETDPLSINTGGWGLRLKTEDMAKFGQLFLQKGSWNGKQILPQEWVAEASTMHIIQHPDMPQTKRDSSDWEQGYGYQMWRCRNNAYRGDGAFGQYIIVMPDQDAVIAITSETADMQDELNLVWQYLLPAFQKDTLAYNANTTAILRQKLTSLALPIPTKSTVSPVIADISGRMFAFESNKQAVKNMSFQFNDEVCNVFMRTDKGNFKLSFGAGQWIEGETTKLGPSLVLPAQNHFVGLPPSKIAGSYSWVNDSTLELTLRYIDSPHTEVYTCHFDKNNVLIDYQISFNKKEKQSLKGAF
jgi:CubicO group peptidase (beta-lactamase class C family)